MNEPTWNVLKRQVYERAGGCCEYCYTCESNTGQTLHADGAAQVRGLTPVGRATVVRLKMNRPSIVVARQRRIEGGYHPPSTLSGD